MPAVVQAGCQLPLTQPRDGRAEAQQSASDATAGLQPPRWSRVTRCCICSATSLLQGMEMLVCQSFAKNFGLYAERAGAVHVIAADAASAAAVLSTIEVIARPMYSNPPAHGARIVATILGDAELTRVSMVPQPDLRSS
jgi:hypothetical protein